MKIVLDPNTGEKAVLFTAEEWARTMATFDFLAVGIPIVEGDASHNFVLSMLAKAEKMVG